jgi:hypothetical protein
VGGPHGPYRQSERKEVYKQYVDQLVAAGKAYPCFCTDEELEAMKKDAEEKKLPPIYRGKWASASAEEVADMMAKGEPHCYRFRVPKNQVVKIKVGAYEGWLGGRVGGWSVGRQAGVPAPFVMSRWQCRRRQRQLMDVRAGTAACAQLRPRPCPHTPHRRRPSAAARRMLFAAR